MSTTAIRTTRQTAAEVVAADLAPHPGYITVAAAKQRVPAMRAG